MVLNYKVINPRYSRFSELNSIVSKMCVIPKASVNTFNSTSLLISVTVILITVTP
jgi:hypothetical protein